jgi:hypothetical protein
MANIQERSGKQLALEIKNLPDDYLTCRSQHDWFETKPMHVAESKNGVDIIEQHDTCNRCKTVRTSRLSLHVDRFGVRRLQVLGNKYAYPEDYLIPTARMADRPREIFRFEKMRRVMGGRVNRIRVSEAE